MLPPCSTIGFRLPTVSRILVSFTCQALAPITATTKEKAPPEIVVFHATLLFKVKTRIGEIFLRLFDKHFPRTIIFNKIFNRHILRISFSCAPKF